MWFKKKNKKFCLNMRKENIVSFTYFFICQRYCTDKPHCCNREALFMLIPKLRSQRELRDGLLIFLVAPSK